MVNPGQYLPGKSPVHNRDPRVKIIAVTALSILILHVNAAGLLLATATVLAVSFLAGTAPPKLIRTLRPGWPFFLCLFLMYIFFTPGHALFHSGPVQITYEGLRTGTFQVLRFLLLVLAASILTMTTSPSEIILGLERLLRPLGVFGISSHNTAMMVSLALRFIPTLQEEMTKIREAQLARGANFQPRSIPGKIRALIFLAAPLASGMFRRCDELVEALEARGYQPGPRTYLRELCLAPADYLVLSLAIAAVIAGLAYC